MRANGNFFRKLGAAVLAVGIVFGACAVSIAPVSAAAGFQVVDKNYEKTYKQDDGTVYFEAKGVFPELKSKSKAAKKINQVLKKERNQWIKETAKKAAEANVEVLPSMNASDKITYEVTANDGTYFSVLMSGYDYQGGAHGSPYRIALTFDAKTGKKLTAAKLFGTSKEKLDEKVRKLYLEKYDKEGIHAGFYTSMNKDKSDRDYLKENLAQISFQQAFYIKDGKAVFYAEPYAVGPYAAGYIEVAATAK